MSDTKTNIPTRSQQFAQAAFHQVNARDTHSPPNKDEYVRFAKRFPSLIHTCGLAQAVAFAQSKGPAHFLDDLQATMGVENSKDGDFGSAIRSADLVNYIRLSRQAMEAAGWLKRYAEALLET